MSQMVYPEQRTSRDRPGWSVSCQTATLTMRVALKKNPARRRLSNSSQRKSSGAQIASRLEANGGRLYYLHCPFFLRSAIVIWHDELHD